MDVRVLIVAAAVVLFAGLPAAASFSVTHPGAELYSTSKVGAAWQFTIDFAEASCGDAVEQAFAVTLPQWYEAPLAGDLNAFMQADENTLRYIECSRGTTNPRLVSCNNYTDGNKLAELDSFTILLDARTNQLEGNPVRTETWNATMLCDPAYVPTRTELTDTVAVLSPVVAAASPEPDSVVSGTVDLIAEEVHGIPHYVRFKLTRLAPQVPEMSDASRAGGWSVGFDTTTVQNGTALLKVYACDHALNCAEAVTRTFEVSNPEEPPAEPETDAEKPAISGNSPLEALAGTQPMILATISDNNAVNPETIKFYFDSVVVGHSFYAESGTVSYLPDEPLAEGIHKVRIEAEDYKGNTAVLAWEITATPAPAEPPPPGANRPPEIVSVTATPQYPVPGQEVVFTAEVVDEEPNTLTYSWFFGDGTLSNERSPTHTYALAGGTKSKTFEVSLSVADREYISTYILDLVVRSAPVQPPAGQPPGQPPASPGEGLPGIQQLLTPVHGALIIAFILAVILLYTANHPPRALKAYLEGCRRKKFAEPKARHRKPLGEAEREAKAGFQKLFIEAHRKPAALERELKGKLSEAERGEIRRLVFLLRHQKKRYSRAEMVKAILGEGYSERVAEKAVGLIYNSKDRGKKKK